MVARPTIADFSLREMQDRDLASVMQIEEQVYRFPWSRQIFRDCIRVGYYCRVCLDDMDSLIAYTIASSGAGEAHILNLCVDPAFQGRGIGRYMLQNMLDQLQADGLESVFLEVRPSNPSAIHLYEQLGFNEIGRRTNYYPAENGREDALVYALSFFEPA